MQTQTGRVSRREVLQGAVAGATAAIVPRHVLGGAGQTPPSETLAAGLIGCGGQAGEDLNTYIKHPRRRLQAAGRLRRGPEPRRPTPRRSSANTSKSTPTGGG